MFWNTFYYEFINHWIWQYHINKLFFIVRLQSHHDQHLQYYCFLQNPCFHPMLPMYRSTCSHNNCKTLNSITVPLSSCKLFISMNGESGLVSWGITIRIGRFPVQTLLDTQPGLGSRACYKATSDHQVEIIKTQWFGWVRLTPQ